MLEHDVYFLLSSNIISTEYGSKDGKMLQLYALSQGCGVKFVKLGSPKHPLLPPDENPMCRQITKASHKRDDYKFQKTFKKC